MDDERSTPLACTLGPRAMRDRQILVQDLLRRHDARVEWITDGARLCFAEVPGLAAALAELVELERACCPFFTFRMTAEAGALTLEVTAPPAGADLVRALASAIVPEPTP
jgi:hypothetical protein